MLKTLRPLVRIAAELRRIATVMEYFAIDHARQNNRMFTPSGRRQRFGGGKDESELFHTDDAAIAGRREVELALLIQRGYPALEAEDQVDESLQES